MSDDNPMAKIVQLRELIRAAGEEIGLHLEGFGIFPSNDPDDPHDYAQAVFHIDMDAVFGEPEPEVDPEQAQFDAQFEDWVAGQTDFERAAEVAAARKDIERTLMLDNPKRGIGLDD